MTLLAGDPAVSCSILDLLRNAGGNVGFLAIDHTQTDITVGAGGTDGVRIAVYFRHCSCGAVLSGSNERQPDRRPAKKHNKLAPVHGGRIDAMVV
jgi:hypothetical protein